MIMNRQETGTGMVRAPEFSENSPENRELTRDNIERYIEGCEELAVRLDDIIEKVIDSNKRPVILIPSRGAVPIFLLARRFLNQLHDEGSYLDGRNARYYPEGVFDYLEGQNPKQPDQKTTVDVILYPFTADVSLENTDDETIAKELRNSCTRSVMQIVQGRDYGRYDYEWYKFLMKKLIENQNDPENLRPSRITSAFDFYPKPEDVQIILIDTVISGRAADDITRAFKTLGHTVIPLLAVDNTRRGKFQPARKHEIEETLRPIWQQYLSEKGVFVEFPLITEDKGSALLGVVALNFINFNQEGIFQRVTSRFDPGFRPQSCVWTLPPEPARKLYLDNFRNFLNVAWSCRNGSPNPCAEQQIENLAKSSKPLTATHESPTYSEISLMVNMDKGAELKESASHIVSIGLNRRQAETWVKEFASQLSHSAP